MRPIPICDGCGTSATYTWHDSHNFSFATWLHGIVWYCVAWLMSRLSSTLPMFVITRIIDQIRHDWITRDMTELHVTWLMDMTPGYDSWTWLILPPSARLSCHSLYKKIAASHVTWLIDMTDLYKTWLYHTWRDSWTWRIPPESCPQYTWDFYRSLLQKNPIKETIFCKRDLHAYHLSHVTCDSVMCQSDESCHVWFCHVSEPCHVWFSHVSESWVMSHVMYDWVMSHMIQSCLRAMSRVI